MNTHKTHKQCACYADWDNPHGKIVFPFLNKITFTGLQRDLFIILYFRYFQSRPPVTAV